MRTHPCLSKLFPGLLAVTLWAAVAAPAVAAGWNEAVQGDLSDNGLQPSLLRLQTGSNVVSGLFGRSAVPDVSDLDYLTVEVPDQTLLSALVLTALDPGGANSFLAVQRGPQVTLDPSGRGDVGVLLSYAHIYKTQIGQDLLPALVLQPLTPGRYSFWINETDTSQVWSYTLDFQLAAAPVPEPGMVWLWLGALPLLRRALGRSRG